MNALRRASRSLVPAMIVVLLLAACTTTDQTLIDSITPEEPVDNSLAVRIDYLEIDDWRIRYARAGRRGAVQVVFLHGGPGSLDNYEPYFKRVDLLNEVELLGVDRPGYAGSNLGRVETSMERQAELIRPLIRPGAIVVGHSFGATVAARLAMDFPELVSGLVLVAGSLSPEHERPFFFTHAFERPLLNWMLSRPLRMANAEKATRIPELTLMADLWSRIHVPVTLMHGTRDSLVPVDHSRYVHQKLGPELSNLIILDGEQHFILWSHVDEITAVILDHARKQRDRSGE